MSINLCLWITVSQSCDKIDQAVDLTKGEVKISTAFIAHATDKADADRISIVAYSMGPDNLMNPAVFDSSVPTDHMVIANIIEASIQMPCTNLVYSNIHRDFSVGTVDDDLLDSSHAFTITLKRVIKPVMIVKT